MIEFVTQSHDFPGEEMVVNMGPQHPSTHGVLRVQLVLSGETIVRAIPDIGYLHRGIEKIAEGWTYAQVPILADRIDYLSCLSNEHVYCMAVEQLMDVEVPERAEYIRVIMAELQRLASHLIWWGCFGLDMGAVTPFLYALREREAVLDLFEMVAGARMTTNYIRIGGVRNDLPSGFDAKLKDVVKQFHNALDEYKTLVSGNPIFQRRTRSIAVMDADTAVLMGASGATLRGSGINWDVRKAKPYSVYDRFAFDVPLGSAGDCFDRYDIRVEEMRQSLRIIEQAIEGLPEGPVQTKLPKVLKPPVGEALATIEAPRGEVSVYLVSDGGTSPYRMRWRSPTFVHLQLIPLLSPGIKIADIVALIGSIDIVLGEVDR